MQQLNETTFAQCARNSHVFPMGTHGICPKCGDRQISPFKLKLDVNATFMMALMVALGDVLGRMEHYSSWVKQHEADATYDFTRVPFEQIEGEADTVKHAKRLMAWGMHGQTPCEHTGCKVAVTWPGSPFCDKHHVAATTDADVAMLTKDGA